MKVHELIADLERLDPHAEVMVNLPGEIVPGLRNSSKLTFPARGVTAGRFAAPEEVRGAPWVEIMGTDAWQQHFTLPTEPVSHGPAWDDHGRLRRPVDEYRTSMVDMVCMRVLGELAEEEEEGRMLALANLWGRLTETERDEVRRLAAGATGVCADVMERMLLHGDDAARLR